MKKIIETDSYKTKCECGEFVKQRLWVKKEIIGETGELKDTYWNCHLGFCECGNIFIGRYPSKEEKLKNLYL
jgi:hypothetical protein